jgi:hypothetical protein
LNYFATIYKDLNMKKEYYSTSIIGRRIDAPLKEKEMFDVGANFQEGGSGIRVSADLDLEKTCHMGLLFLFVIGF